MAADGRRHGQPLRRRARALLPGLPEDVVYELEIGAQLAVPGYGVGGATASRGRVVAAVDPAADVEPDELAARLRAAVFHESMHVVQG
jgi:hypothetical protein